MTPKGEEIVLRILAMCLNQLVQIRLVSTKGLFTTMEAKEIEEITKELHEVRREYSQMRLPFDQKGGTA